MIKLLDIQNNVVIPTEHCQTIKWLKVIKDKFPEDYMKLYAYIFYMACPGEANPYFNLVMDLREETVIQDIEINRDLLEEDEVIDAVEKATKLYETPTVRAYKGITTMLDNITEYMETTKPTAGRDGNLPAMIRLAKDFDDIRQSYKGVAKDLAAEQESQVRGGQNLSYDQL
jgi:hypothetical protein